MSPYGPLWLGWSPMVPYVPLWPYMVPHDPERSVPLGLVWSPDGPLWSNVFLYGPVWSHLVLFSPLWSCMVFYGPVWFPMTPYGPLWFWMVPYVLVWLCIVLYSPVWLCMVPYDPIWSCMVFEILSSWIVLLSPVRYWILVDIESFAFLFCVVLCMLTLYAILYYLSYSYILTLLLL